MVRSHPERGSARAVTIVVVALALLGGAASVMTGSLPDAFTLKSPQSAVKTGFKAREAPVVKESAAAPASRDPELAKVKMGDLVQFRDENGTVRYRLREPIVGRTGDGRPTSWVLEMLPSPQTFDKAPKPDKSSKKGKRPVPAITGTISNGKLSNGTPPEKK